MSLLYIRHPSMPVALGFLLKLNCDETAFKLRFEFQLASLQPGPGYAGQVLYRDATEAEAGGKTADYNMYRVEPPSDCCQFFKTCLEPDVVYRCSKSFIRLGGAGCSRVDCARLHILILKYDKPVSKFAFNFNVRGAPLQ